MLILALCIPFALQDKKAYVGLRYTLCRACLHIRGLSFVSLASSVKACQPHLGFAACTHEYCESVATTEPDSVAADPYELLEDDSDSDGEADTLLVSWLGWVGHSLTSSVYENT